MPTEKKIAQVKALEEKLGRCAIAVSTEYRGMTVGQMNDLRRKLRENDIEFLVVKNNLLAIAAENAGKSGLREVVRGPTGIAFGYGDVVGPAKVLHEHIQAAKIPLSITGAFTDGRVLQAAEVRFLATLPPRPVLMGQVMGGLLAPLRGLAYVLSYHLGGLARVLDARRQQMEGSES
ncbi:MAG: 50S ribosomal protein L10 [Chloroflexi bacterium]|nr:50S ribosomal protein L10 [Chloroflexota bacterium]